MEVNFRQNVRVGPELVSALWSVRFSEVSALESLRYEGFLKNWSGTNDTVRLREVVALEDVRFREVSLYYRRNSCYYGNTNRSFSYKNHNRMTENISLELLESLLFVDATQFHVLLSQ